MNLSGFLIMPTYGLILVRQYPKKHVHIIDFYVMIITFIFICFYVMIIIICLFYYKLMSDIKETQRCNAVYPLSF